MPPRLPQQQLPGCSRRQMCRACWPSFPAPRCSLTWQRQRWDSWRRWQAMSALASCWHESQVGCDGVGREALPLADRVALSVH